jgi:hypothetical protein
MKTKQIIADIGLVITSGLLSLLAIPQSSGILIAVSTGLAAFSGVVVTVFGIWVAVIFPRLLTGLESGAKAADLPDRSRYDALIKSLYRSCFVLCASFFVLLLTAFADVRSSFLYIAFAFFAWLCFFSIATSLWSSVANGEVAAVVGINDGILKGVVKRVRGKGRRKKAVSE